jgi:predicted TIM-barrel fold metal-dependent hydrolase
MTNAMIVSADGHAVARMADYRPYLPASMRAEFDQFCAVYDEYGYPSCDPRNLASRLDPDMLDKWVRSMIESDRIAGRSDPRRRLELMDEIGIVCEVLFPDFGVPFELFTPRQRMAHVDKAPWPPRTREQSDAANRAHNRWLVDFCSVARERFVPMASVAFDDVDAAVEEIRWAKEAGFSGVLVPTFTEDVPLFDPRFEPIWSVLEELDMPLNSHASISSTYPLLERTRFKGMPAPISYALNSRLSRFYCREVVTHFIWSGIFERHPRLRLCLTEQGTGWILSALAEWDYTWGGSYLRRDSRDIVPRPPSEYFREHCFFGSSLFSAAEVEARHRIGLDQILLGMDYPHHEGTFAAGGTIEYLRATLGSCQVPADEAALMLGENAIRRWGLDRDKLRAHANRVGPSLERILDAPDVDLFPRGDVHKPLV